MSRRIRTVKPEWLEDEVLAAASDEARVLSIGLILLADDYGNGRASMATIAAEVWRFALERDDGAHASEVLEKASRAFRELVAKKFVGVWTVNGQRYYAIRNWLKHQRVDKPGKPLVPSPPAGLFDEVNPEQIANSGDSREGLSRVSIPVRDTAAPDLDLRPGPKTNDLEGTVAPAREDAPAPPPKGQVTEQEPAARAPRNPTEAMAMPIADRAAFVERNRHQAEWLTPEAWPEVMAVAQRLHDACGGKGRARIAAYHRDSGVRAVVTLFAAGFTQLELEQVASGVVRRPWWTSEGGKPRSLGALTVEVVRRELAEAPVASAPDLLPETRAQIARDSGGLALMREAEALASGAAPATAPRPTPVKAVPTGAIITDLSKHLGGRV